MASSERIKSALSFEVHVTAKGESAQARASTMSLPHGKVLTPVFMPVGTQAAMKGVTYSEMADSSIDCKLLLSNTYHLALRPGTETIDELGGIHDFKGWKRNVLTDSGGFQMVSLLKLAKITEEGVTFQSPVDGTAMLLTPERSIRHQHQIGSDIVMALDDVVPATCTDHSRFEEACYRTIRWIDRCVEAMKPKAHCQSLFGIVQGGLNDKLRDYCLTEMVKRDEHLRGYAIGGLCGGEEKDLFWRTVYQCTKALPKNKPRYVMGVGFPLDLVVCTALGADMFDCVHPCRTARFGTALTRAGEISLKSRDYRFDFSPIDLECECSTCQNYSRALLHQLAGKQSTCATLISVHNIHFLLSLMSRMRKSILDGVFEEFIHTFMMDMFPKKNFPQWTVDAFNEVGITLPG